MRSIVRFQRQTDLAVVHTGLKTEKTYIVMSPTIYGLGTGHFSRLSFQVPTIIRAALKTKQAEYIGDGHDAWDHIYIPDLVDLYEIVAAKILAGEDFPSGEKGFYCSETGHHSWKKISQGVGDVLSKLCIEKTKEAKSMSLEVAATGFAVGDKVLAEVGFTSKYIMRTTLYISDTDADLHATAQGLSQNVVDVLVGDPGGIRPI